MRKKALPPLEFLRPTEDVLRDHIGAQERLIALQQEEIARKKTEVRELLRENLEFRRKLNPVLPTDSGWKRKREDASPCPEKAVLPEVPGLSAKIIPFPGVRHA